MVGSKSFAFILAGVMILTSASVFGQATAPAAPELRDAPPVTVAPAAPGAPAIGTPVEGGKAVPADANAAAPTKAPGLFGDQYFLFIMLGALVLMFLLSSRSKKKQEQKRKDQLSSMKKGDRVQTIGGIIGTIIEVKPDEVVVKVDEQNNVRMRFIPAAIAQVGEVKGAEEKK